MMKKQSKQKGARRQPRREMIPHPPPIANYGVDHGVKLRFVVGAALLDLGVTYQNLLDLILWASSATAPYDVFTSVKVRRVSMWATPVLGNATTVVLQYQGATAGSIGNQKVVTDTSMGIEPAHVSAKPGVNTLASMYQISSGAVAFQLTCPAGTVVDCDLSFKNAPGTALLAQNPSVAVTVGILAYRGLDGLAQATSKFTTAVGPQI